MSDSWKDDLGTSRSYESKYTNYDKLRYEGNQIDEGDNDLKIVAVQKEVNGEVRAYQLSDGRIVSVHKAVEMCNRGLLGDYITASRWDGDAYIRTRPNGTRGDNLSNLPEF